LKGISRLLKEL
jgi:hypothetical protein